MHLSYNVVGVLLLLSLYQVQASEIKSLPTSEEPLQPIGFFGTVTGDVEIGFLLNSGNTDSFAIRINSELVHELEYFRNRYQLFSMNQKSKVFDSASQETHQQTTANRYGFTGQSNYKIVSGRETIFGRGAYMNDKFAAFKTQASLVVGYGNRMYEKQSSYIDLETGPGFGYQEDSTGLTESGLIWFLAANIDYPLTTTTKFRQTLESTISFNGQNSTTISRSSFSTRVVEQLSMRLSYVLRHNSKPRDNRKNTDTELSASLVFTF